MNLLIPPGWQEGDPPIDPTQAREIFDERRKIAHAELVEDAKESEDLELEEQMMLKSERDKVWERDYNIEKYILEIRVEIYDTYARRQREKAEREREKAYSESARRVQSGTFHDLCLHRSYLL